MAADGTSDPDDYAAGRARLLETTRWYATSLAAVAAVLTGGMSFGILPELADAYLVQGLVAGGVILFAILAAIMLIHNILVPRELDPSWRTDERLKERVDARVPEITSEGITSYEQLLKKIAAGGEPGDIDVLKRQKQNVEGFAAFCALERKVKFSKWAILLLFAAAVVSTGYLIHLQGLSRQAVTVATVPVTFSPGADWRVLSDSLAAACPAAGPLTAEGRGDMPFAGWWTITLTEPSPCSGASFSVPAEILTLE